MCEFFSCIATKDGRLLFTEEDHHQTTINRANLSDASLFTRTFVRLECRPPFDKVTVDETGTLPGWFDFYEWEHRVMDLAQRISPARQEYKTIEGPALQKYKTIEGPALQKCAAIRDLAWQKYLAIENPVWQKYLAIEGPAQQEYKAIEGLAWQAYLVIEGPALQGYIEALRRIEGYVPEVK
jgi:hypothetical protein